MFRRLTALRLVVTAVLLLFSAAGVFSQEEDAGIVPEALRRPRHGEAPRFPEDLVIGSLERGPVPENAWKTAGEILSALVAGNRSALSSSGGIVLDDLLAVIGGIESASYRLGSGREEPDGSVSFLVRFMGREEWIAGELYLRPMETGEADGAGASLQPADPLTAEGSGGQGGDVPPAEAAGRPAVEKWLFDDLLLEEKHERGTERDNRSFDFSPYERFF
jgi:hypothetical protein